MQVRLESVSVKRGGRVVLRNITATFTGPGLYQVIGPNGSGKTTLLLTVIGRVKPVTGRVLVDNIVVRSTESVRGLVSYMPQNYTIPLDAPVTLYEFVENLARISGRVVSVEEALELAGISRSYWSRKLSELSGGLLQRAMLARTLVLDTPIVLLDEPFSNIDPEGKTDISDHIGELSRRKLVVVTSHDPTLLLDYTERILVLGYGNYVFGTIDDILRLEVLSKFYKKCAVELKKHIHIIDWH